MKTLFNCPHSPDQLLVCGSCLSQYVTDIKDDALNEGVFMGISKAIKVIREFADDYRYTIGESALFAVVRRLETYLEEKPWLSK